MIVSPSRCVELCERARQTAEYVRVASTMHLTGWLSFFTVIASLHSAALLASPLASEVIPVPPPDSTAQTSTSGDEHDEPVLHHRVNVGLGPLLYVAPTGPIALGWAVEASYGGRHNERGMEAEVGFRAIVGERVSGPVDFDLFASVALAPTIGSVWEPRIAVEFGISTAANAPIAPDIAAPESFYRLFSDTAPGYVGTAFAPARFRWRRWRLETMEIFMGSAVPRIGQAARLQINFIRLGVHF